MARVIQEIRAGHGARIQFFTASDDNSRSGAYATVAHLRPDGLFFVVDVYEIVAENMVWRKRIKTADRDGVSNAELMFIVNDVHFGPDA